MHSLARILRQAAADALPEGAFLRRDRGEALYVTNAPFIRPGMDWAALLAEAGFRCTGGDGLLRLWPDEGWLIRLEAACPDPPDDLCRSLLRFRGRSADGDSLRLFTMGLRLLDGGEDGAAFDRRLRRRAAECLRLNALNPNEPPRGGGLYACALLDHELTGGNLT